MSTDFCDLQLKLDRCCLLTTAWCLCIAYNLPYVWNQCVLNWFKFYKFVLKLLLVFTFCRQDFMDLAVGVACGCECGWLGMLLCVCGWVEWPTTIQSKGNKYLNEI